MSWKKRMFSSALYRLSSFMLKPMIPENVKEQLAKLRYPFQSGGVE